MRALRLTAQTESIISWPVKPRVVRLVIEQAELSVPLELRRLPQAS